jgi:hypothetical protein
MFDARAAPSRMFLGTREADGLKRVIDSGDRLLGRASLFE